MIGRSDTIGLHLITSAYGFGCRTYGINPPLDYPYLVKAGRYRGILIRRSCFSRLVVFFPLFKKSNAGGGLSVAGSQYIRETEAILLKAFRSGGGHPGGNA